MTATATKPLRAYHGSEELKEETVSLARLGREADEFAQGVYFSRSNGHQEYCAVGCLTKNSEGGHALYPEKWGIPEWLAHLEDQIFEGLPFEQAKFWPERFLAAVPVGADFDGLADRLAVSRLKEECLPLSGEWPESIRAKVVAAIEQVIAALEGKGARSAVSAEHAAESAEFAAEFAARSAVSAASAEHAAESAEFAAVSAESAEFAARSAEHAAESAAEFAARSAVSAESAARFAAHEREGDRLIAGLEALPTETEVAV